MTNIAKIYLHLGDEAKAAEWVTRAVNTNKNIIVNRLQVDKTLKNLVLTNPSLAKVKGLIES